MLTLFADMQKAQLWMVAGFLMLGWVLARRQLKTRKRVNEDNRIASKELKKLREHKDPAIPLANAPVDVQRWQGAMFDLQRELKAELDSRIGIVQVLVHQLDERIAKASELTGTHIEQLNLAEPIARRETIAALSREGHSSQEIATKTGLPIGDVELMLGTLSSS
ncbi:hypothetical protein N9N28_12185 [Rubripirellula amarantea]|uniref:DUF2802 domain-containing protein n=1 Tax=Rubripirellula amarantea TaxID=2527999 RepID=A0A5C5WU62_9BACT|nr:hypothetical protein [Rubripirellula amarantea]MDA8745385.1 hypothetical protein [Rubripirellula amarantea]TWT53759.1 hypothetical protein Pla22_13910 [Rubripirellula amarantea]